MASKLLTGNLAFLAGEGEVERVIFEFGPYFGLAFIIFRWMLAVMISAKAFAKVRERQTLAWFLVPSLFALLGFDTLDNERSRDSPLSPLDFPWRHCKAFGVSDGKQTALSAQTGPSPENYLLDKT